MKPPQYPLMQLAALMGLIAVDSLGGDTGRPTVFQSAERFILDQARTVRCDDSHFVYGVAYIDGSYMERLFLVRDPGGGPRFELVFRDTSAWSEKARDAEPEDLPPAAFSLELTVSQARHAEPRAGQWIDSGGEWESGLRFKYTYWYGEIQRRQGQWELTWQGYRRPMLPPSLLADGPRACGIFDHP